LHPRYAAVVCFGILMFVAVAVVLDASAYQGIILCRDCQLTPPGVAGTVVRDPASLQPPGAPVHNYAAIARQRHSSCVSGLGELSGIVGEIEKLKSSAEMTSARLPELQKAFKKSSKTVAANCF